MHLTISRGFDIQFGSGLYRVRLEFYGIDRFFVRVPYFGKVWSFGPTCTGRTSWEEVKQEDPTQED